MAVFAVWRRANAAFKSFRPRVKWWTEVGPFRLAWCIDGTLRAWDAMGRWVLLVRDAPQPLPHAVDNRYHPRTELFNVLRKINHVASPNGHGSHGDPKDANVYTSLWEYLSATKYPDGAERVPSTIVVIAEAGRWKACLSDKDNARSCWKSADTLEELLLLLDQAASINDPTDWRTSKPFEPKKKK